MDTNLLVYMLLINFCLFFVYSLVHSVLLDYLNECNDEDRAEMITAFSPFIPSLASTKEGVRASMICFWNSIVKDRRVSNEQ